MGQTQPKTNQNQPAPDIKINHEKFHNFIYHEQNDLIEISIDMQNERDLKSWDGHLKRLDSFEEKDNLLLPNKRQFSQKGFCGTAGACKIFYENYPYLFEEQIENRIEMGKYFEEEELWYLLYSLVSSARDFSKINSKIGDVRPYNIFINEEGQIKIANLFSWPYQYTNFQKTAFSRTLTYLSPQELKLIAKGNYDNNTDKILSQSFAIGVTLLQAGSLFNAKEMYSIKDFSIDLGQLSRRVGAWHNLEFAVEGEGLRRYSTLLRNIVAGMCNPDERERLVSLKVEELLRPHANQILNLKEFDTNSINLPFQTQQVITRQSPQQAVSPPKVIQRPQSSPRKVFVQNQPQAPPVVVPQQTIVVSRPPEPKVNSNVMVKFNQGEHVVIGGREPNRYPEVRPQSVPGNYDVFHKYAVNQPEPARVVRIENGPTQAQYEQQFYKYSTMNPPVEGNFGGSNHSAGFRNTTSNIVSPPPPQPQPLPSTKTLNFNSQGYSSSIQGKPWDMPPPPTTTTTSQFARPYSSIQGSTQVVTSTSVQGGVGDSSDFLRRIDEQLQASRKQFPSS